MDAPDAQASLPGLQSPGTRGAAAILRRVVGGDREDRPGTAGRLGEQPAAARNQWGCHEDVTHLTTQRLVMKIWYPKIQWFILEYSS